MRKTFTTPEYKEWNKRRSQKIRQKRQRQTFDASLERFQSDVQNFKNNTSRKFQNTFFDTFSAPTDFRIIENTEACLNFFRSIRNENNLNHHKNMKFILMSLKEVKQIDYGTISILTAISDDLKFKEIMLQGDFPDDIGCKQFIIDSGFLNHMVDAKNHKFPRSAKSDLIFFEKGSGRLSTKDNQKISILVKNVVEHLTGESSYCLPIKTIILEICGNSIEWGNSDNKQWLLGVKYEDNQVIFTVTDVGRGILDTLYRKFEHIFKDVFKSRDQILLGAFQQKYGSTTQENNRNKGLPAVKESFDQQTIHHLKVLTNNVILHFDGDIPSRTLKKGSPRFRGTFYQWVMTNECILKANKS